jgi:predicted O-methyltransferase YrrM
MVVNIQREAQKPFLHIHKLLLHARLQILPDHYYSPVANIKQLEATQKIWARRSDMPGVAVDLDEQADNLKKTCLPYQEEYIGNRFMDGYEYGPGFGFIEAQALYSVIRTLKPRRIIEVGSGNSTATMVAAATMNYRECGHMTEITCIEPYLYENLKKLPGITIIEKMVQEVPVEVFEKLGRGDLLFIDSSHAVKPGSDVVYLYLEVLPRLSPDVMIHIHDIYFPYDYQRDLLHTIFQSSETALLHALLIHNSRLEIAFCLSHLHYDRREVLKEVFPEYSSQNDRDGLTHEFYPPFEAIKEHFPSSIYIRTKTPPA